MFQIRLATIFTVLILCFTLFTPHSLANQSQFSSTYDVTYKVNESGNTTVTQNVHLTNLTSDVFASEYVLRLSDTGIFNLHAIDRKGPIKITQEVQNGHEVIRFKFNEHITGIGKTLHWTIIYETSKIAQKNGRIWEISIPPPEISSNTKSYTIGLYVPPSFGLPLYLKPHPNLGASLWKISNDLKSGISATYQVDPKSGPPYQAYNFNLKYHLQNTGFLANTSQIALPSDTDYQKVFLKSLTPKPQKVTLDKDGNWIASYSVNSSSTLNVSASGSIAVFNHPQFKTSSKQDLSMYLQPKQFWETKNNSITQIAKELKTPEKIYNYVVKKLHYDPERITKRLGRLGAVKALATPTSAICMEFTDLFIALARAAGIPAREIDGYGFTSDQLRQPVSSGRDILHAWPQYYDTKSKSWKMVDPTWGNTTGGIDYFHTFDFAHIAFVTRGQSSVSPLPAGSYKIFKTEFGKQGQSRDIQIVPTSGVELNQKANLEITFDNYSEIITPFTKSLEINIKNFGPVISPSSKLQIKSSLTISPPTIDIAPIPPFGQKSYPVNLKANSPLEQGNAIISFELNGQKVNQSIKIIPFYKSPIFLVGGIISLVIISIITKITWSLFFQKRLR